MTKADLKDGMVCKVRDGSVYIWFQGKLIGMTDYCSCTMNNLTNGVSSGLDIIEVYETHGNNIKNIFDVGMYGTLIWEREEPKELTVAEIEKLLGYPVKIVKE